MDFEYMKALRCVANEVKADFWLMGEVIHGNYSMWASDNKLHSVTNYELHKALYSGHNDHNYFEIAHNVKRMIDNCGILKLYTFVDNHDVSRIASKLNNKLLTQALRQSFPTANNIGVQTCNRTVGGIIGIVDKNHI